MAGVSRSVALVIAYLIKIKGVSYDEAYSIVKRRRRIVNIDIFRFIQMMDL